MISDKLDTWRPLQRKLLINVLIKIGPLYTTEIIDIVKQILNNPISAIDELNTYFGKKEITHEDVTLDLSWLLYNSARFEEDEKIRMELLKMLCKVSLSEIKILENKPNLRTDDGKRGVNLIPRLISEGEFDQIYDYQGYLLANTILDGLNQMQIDEFWPILNKYIIHPLLKIDRTRTIFTGNRIQTARYLLDTDGDLWKERIKIIDKTKDLINKSKNDQDFFSWIKSEELIELWRIFGTAHTESNRSKLTATREFPSRVNEFENELIDNLASTLDYLKGLDRDKININELNEMKSIWDWHLSYEKSIEIKQIALLCEEEYIKKNKFSAEFDLLYKNNDHDSLKTNTIQKSKELANQDISDIKEFVIIYLPQANWFCPII